jgi:hypothetical protein
MKAQAPDPFIGGRPLLLPALALWGWQAELLPVALLMGLVLEAPRFVALRFDIRQGDFERLWSFTSVLFLAVIFYLLIARQGLGNLTAVGAVVVDNPQGADQDGLHRVSDTALTFLRWLPYILFPFTIAHAWSRAVTVPWSTFSLYEQARAKRDPQGRPPEWAARPMHPGYLYLGVTLFASTTAAINTETYLPALFPLVVLALWPWRNRRYGVVAWLLVLSAFMGIAVLARYAQHAPRDAWQALENHLIQDGGGSRPDQSFQPMAIGHIGQLKQSGSILLWIDSADSTPPGLLREASFNRYQRDAWMVPRQGFELLDPARLPGPAAGQERHTLIISRYALPPATPLAVPGDVRAVRSVSTASIEVNDLAALRLHEELPLARYEVDSGPGGGLSAPPLPEDTSLATLSPPDRAAVRAAAAAAGLTPDLAPEAAIADVERWFDHGFTYSLWQDHLPEGVSPLANFLQTSHAGHCEFYATATTLLLRAAGVPTRYAVGYSVEERRDATWLARGRDAHAWCLAWVGGRWRDVDTTPGTWRAGESAAGAAWWQGLSDAWTQGWYRFAEWRQYGGSWRLVVFIAGSLVLAWMAWRQLRGSRWRRVVRTAPDATSEAARAGLDSEFFAVLSQLATVYGPRLPAETVAAWLRRCLPAQDPRVADVVEALNLHQRLRFDPLGLAPAERRRLQHLVAQLVAAWRPTTAVGSRQAVQQ